MPYYRFRPLRFSPRGSNDSEELNQRIEFIVETLARLAVGQEQARENLERLAAVQGRDHEVLVRLAAAQEQDHRNQLEFQVWSKDLTVRVIDMLDRQSQRLDRQDKFYRDSLQQSHEFQTRTEAFQKQALHLLNLVLDRLPPATAV